MPIVTKLWVTQQDHDDRDNSGTHPIEVRQIPTEQAIAQAAEMLSEGGLIAFPTETVYGLGASALDAHALTRVFEAKGRPQDNPLIAHISDLQQIGQIAQVPNTIAQHLMEAFWPGPLSILLPVLSNVPKILTAGLDYVAVRMPDHPLALALIAKAGMPIAAPSANVSGKPSPTTALHVVGDLAGRIDGILDGGSCEVGIESTVIEIVEDTIVILRPGKITRQDLLPYAKAVLFDPYLKQGIEAHTAMTPRAPGQKYRHYAPQGQLNVFFGESVHNVQSMMQSALIQAKQVGKKTAVLTLDAHVFTHADWQQQWGDEKAETLMQQLYGALRTCDDLRSEVIIAQGPPDDEQHHALINRLLKASGGNFITVS